MKVLQKHEQQVKHMNKGFMDFHQEVIQLIYFSHLISKNTFLNAFVIGAVLPDFAQVYGFIGSVFDPNTAGHLHRLKKMDPIDVETVLLLMRNLSINLTSPDFEDHVSFLQTLIIIMIIYIK